MFDFVKIEVCTKVALKWLNCSRLNFIVSVSYNTGDVSNNKLIAKYKGLIFTIFYEDNTLTKIKYTEVSGSLHKFKNNGKSNADDFTFLELQKVVSDLNKLFYINPQTAILHNLEFAVNVYLPITVHFLLKSLVAFKSFKFKSISDGRKHIGEQIINAQHKFKIYDKGKQSNLTDVKNLARFEMHYNKMQHLNNVYKIVYLSDLCVLEKVKGLVNEIVKRWEDVIYYDNSINITHLTPLQQRRVLQFDKPNLWKGYNNSQRYKKKKQFNEYMQKYGSNTQTIITILICRKWKELTAEKRGQIYRPQKQNSQQKKGDKFTVRLYSKFIAQTQSKHTNQKTQKNTKKPNQKKGKKRRVCIVCKKSILHKKRGAKYCSKKCNNKYNGMKRTKQRQNGIILEKKNLEKLIYILPKKRMWLMISYKTDSGIYTDTLKQTEIATTKEWIKKVQKILVTEYRKNAPPIVLTSYRARRLLTLINNENPKQNE